MKILHVTPTYMPAWRYGGPIRSVHGLCAALARRGHEVHVFTTSVDGPDDLNVPVGVPNLVEGVKVWYFRSRFLRRLFYSPALREALRARVRDFDIVHTHSIFLWPTWAAAREARAEGIPYIISPRGMLVRDLIKRKSTLLKRAWITLVEKRNLSGAAAIHVTSDSEEKELRHFGLQLLAIVMVPNGVTMEGPECGDLPPMVDAVFRGNRPVVLFLGRITWKKGLDRLLRAFEHVPDAHLLLVGNDEEDYTTELQAIVRNLGIAARVTFGGPMHGPARRELYRRAALCVLPSYSENFGNVVLEAMSESCPVIVTREVGLAAVVATTGAGLVVGGTPIEISAGIASLLSDSERREAMGRAGRQCVIDNFGWDGVAGQMERAYRAAQGAGYSTTSAGIAAKND